MLVGSVMGAGYPFSNVKSSWSRAMKLCILQVEGYR